VAVNKATNAIHTRTVSAVAVFGPIVRAWVEGVKAPHGSSGSREVCETKFQWVFVRLRV